MATYGEIKQHVRDVTHRADLTDDLMDVWSASVTARVNDELDSNVQIARLSVTPSANPWAVGELQPSGDLDVGLRILELLTTADNGDTYKLQATSRDQVTQWVNEAGGPLFYCQEGNSVYVAPFAAQEYTVVCRLDVNALKGNNKTNVVTNTHPDIYYYGMLQRAYEYMRDVEMAERYRQLFDAEIERVNMASARRATPANIQVSGASTWH